MTSDELLPHAGPIVGGLVALLLLLMQFPAARRRKQLAAMPLVKTKGAFAGLVQLEGTMRSDHPLVSYLAEMSCVTYGWDISEHWQRTVVETYTDSEGRTQTRTRTESGWSSVASGTDRIRFELEDETGRIWVDPQGAKIDGQDVFSETVNRGSWLYYGKGPGGGVSNSTGTRRFTEWALPTDSFTYVGGTCRSTEADPGIEIGLGKTDRFFVIDTDGQADVVKGLHGREIWLWIGALLAIAIGGFVGAHQGLSQSALIADVALAGGIFLFFWLMGWFVNVRNAARELENRVEQAWSLVDVQLKRRYDLVPNLVTLAKTSGDYESRVQSLVADLRGGGTNLVAEKYPDLQSSAVYRKLMTELADTENRLALARGYHTEALSLFRTHMEKFPDGFIARLMGIKSSLLE
ncbi:hypothetical protein BH11ARM2_BH11ARM2_28600 [soil metagenome]